MMDALGKLRIASVLWLVLYAGMLGCAAARAPASSEQTESSELSEQAWKWLFDGSDLDQWTGLGRPDIPTGSWQIVGDTLHKTKGAEDNYGGDLRTKQRFSNFELCFEFKLTQGANSGVKYNVSEAMSAQHGHPSSAIGFEFQILDDKYHPDAKMGRDGNRTVGALYDIYPPAASKPVVAAGDWHEGCVRADNNSVRHSLDGTLVLEYRLTDPDFINRVADSKFASIEGFTDWRKGYIVLQDHFDELWYRNIRVRRLAPFDS